MNQNNVVKVLKHHPDAIIPKYATVGAACFDLHTVDCGVVGDRSNAVVFATGLKFEVPDGFVMLIYSRSGHGFKNDLRLANCVGVIDSDYRGEVMVKLTLDSKVDFPVQKGDRIAQAMIIPVQQFAFQQVQELSETVRGENGLGSTGTGRKFFGQPK